jgi:hypothetical protein
MDLPPRRRIPLGRRRGDLVHRYGTHDDPLLTVVVADPASPPVRA